MTSILVLIETIQRNHFRCNYLKDKFSLSFEHFHKKDDPRSWCISQIKDSERRG